MTDTPPAELHCPGCKALLGTFAGGRFRAGGVSVLGAARLACAACGYRWRWSPPQEKVDIPPGRVQTNGQT